MRILVTLSEAELEEAALGGVRRRISGMAKQRKSTHPETPDHEQRWWESHVVGAIGEFERNLIRERVLAGQQRAKANGVKLGRPLKMNDGMRSAVKLLREKGMGIKQIAKQLQIGVGTIYTMI